MSSKKLRMLRSQLEAVRDWCPDIFECRLGLNQVTIKIPRKTIEEERSKMERRKKISLEFAAQ